MHHRRTIVFGFAAALALGACTDLTAYRELTVRTEGAVAEAVPCEVDPAGHAVRPEICKAAPTDTAAPPRKPPALVEHSYLDAGGNPQRYLMSFVEFDDQGWFWDRSQMEGLVSHLAKRRKENGQQASSDGPNDAEDFLIITYAHGWRHDARPEDTNVKCFRHLVERFDVIERKLAEFERPRRRKRTVVGVYVGWRGLSTEGPEGWELASFWERKSTAERVGHGGVTELLVTLNELRGRWNPERARGKTQLIVTGHSFGGKVVYSALSQLLVRRSRQLPVYANRAGFDLETATSFGDLMVLINPAFEGALYEPLFQSAVNRCYPAWQRPISLIVTSDDDAATRVSFPLGHGLANMFEETRPDGDGLQWDSLSRTVGHLDRYQTHKLEWVPKKSAGAPGTMQEKGTALEKLQTRLTTLRTNLNQATEVPDRITDEGMKDCAALGTTAAFEQAAFSEKGGLAALAAYFKPSLKDQDKTTKGIEGTTADGDFTPTSELTKQEIYYGDSRGGALVLTREPEYSPRYPYFVVRTEKSVIEGHNKFYTPQFVDFMLRFFLRHVALRATPDASDKEACFPRPKRNGYQCLFPGAHMCGVSCLEKKNPADPGIVCSDLVRRPASMPIHRAADDR
tara:strand:+ start:2083 stop:3960 length:1878 start_codon:yes stop_codon:yes gene_type:complete